jgi:hypothetical protein
MYGGGYSRENCKYRFTRYAPFTSQGLPRVLLAIETLVLSAFFEDNLETNG